MSKRVRLAPSTGHLARRTAVLLAAGALVVGSVVALEGRPSRERLVHFNEVAGFAPRLAVGSVQLLREALLLAVFAYVGRRWLRVRL